MGICSTQQQSISIPEMPTSNLMPFKKPSPCQLVPPKQLAAKREIYSQQNTGEVSLGMIRFTKDNENDPLEEYNKIKNLKQLYVDKAFKAEQKSIGKLQMQIDKVEWKRPADFIRDKLRFFEGEIETIDLKPGKMQNFYFVSSFATLSHHKSLYCQIIANITNNCEIRKNGAYGIWLFLKGHWRCIVIDDLLPTVLNSYIFSNFLNELWIMLIEKAYAKSFKAYQNIEKGCSGHFLTSITGAPASYLVKDSKKPTHPDDAWKFIREGIEKGYLLSVSTESADRNEYIKRQATFSYPIIDSQEVYILTAKSKKKERILKLDNPWRRYEWKGRWSEYSDVWSEQLRREMDYEKADDSIIWISVEDMLKNFGQVSACQYHPQFINSSLDIKFGQQENEIIGVFIHIEQKTEGFLSLIQCDCRNFVKNYEYSMCRLILLQLDKATHQAKKIIKEISDCDIYCTLDVSLEANTYYLLIEMDWKSNASREVTLNFYGDSCIGFCVDPNIPCANSIFYDLSLLNEDQESNLLEVYTYPHDENIKRVCGQFAGYIYYHYYNNSQQNKWLAEKMSLQNCQHLQVCGEQNPNGFDLNLAPGQEKLVRIKVKKEGNGNYTLNPKFIDKLMEKYSQQDLHKMLKKKPTFVKQRFIEGKQIEVFIKTFEYSGGVALLYENRMGNYSYIQQITFEIDNLRVDNQKLNNNELNIEIEPHSEKLISLVIIEPSKDYSFKTKISFYLDTPEFQF